MSGRRAPAEGILQQSGCPAFMFRYTHTEEEKKYRLMPAIAVSLLPQIQQEKLIPSRLGQPGPRGIFSEWSSRSATMIQVRTIHPVAGQHVRKELRVLLPLPQVTLAREREPGQATRPHPELCVAVPGREFRCGRSGGDFGAAAVPNNYSIESKTRPPERE